jgi:hypothetical protein
MWRKGEKKCAGDHGNCSAANSTLVQPVALVQRRCLALAEEYLADRHYSGLREADRIVEVGGGVRNDDPEGISPREREERNGYL